MAATKVTDVDKGLNALLERLGRKARLRVGVFGDLAAQAAVDGDGATVGDIMSAHEFGHGPPERSWLRGCVDQDINQINTAIRKAAAAVFKGTLTPERAVDQLGFYIEGLMKQRIIAGIAPPLGTVSEGAKAYLRRKLARYPGATTALIASGQALGSISHAVDEGE